MARSVNVFVSGWTNMGATVPVPKYSVNLTINWIDNAGVARTRTETVLFPNCLATFTAAELKEILTDIMLKEARQRLGVDS